MHTDSDNTCELLKLMFLNPGLFAHILNDSVIFSDYPADVPKLSLVPLSETKESPFENDLDSTHKSEGESSLELNESIEDIEMSDVWFLNFVKPEALYSILQTISDTYENSKIAILYFTLHTGEVM